MKKTIGFVLAILTVLVLSSCAAPQTLDTASGRPEVYISGINAHDLLLEIERIAVSQGANIDNKSPTHISISFRGQNTFANHLLSSNYGGLPNDRYSFHTFNQGSGIQVFLTLHKVTNPGSAFEKVHDATMSNAQKLQNHLVDLKNRAENR